MTNGMIRFAQLPLKLSKNRVRRSYTGGRLIEEWQGYPDPKDSDKPEEWVASVVEARNKDFMAEEGLSRVEVGRGETASLGALINQHPEDFLGKEHVKRWGATTALLTKMLDSEVRLSIQVHPTKAFAKEVFKSEFGKTEAWYILSGREIKGELPYVLLGFKPGMTKALWSTYFETQNIEGMIGSLHKFYVNPGDVFLIEGGLPHAIGPGCFLVEIQEPTDFTMRVERKAIDGTDLPDFLCHQGAGFEKMLECFEYETLSREETLKRYFKIPGIKEEGENETIELITREHTSCFRMKKLVIRTEYILHDDSFSSCIVLRGQGQFSFEQESHNLHQGESWFLPASCGDIAIQSMGDEMLELVLCYPPA